jgi:hypothetical protein
MSEDRRDPTLPADRERALSSVLDEVIPPSPDGRLPGAGTLGLAGTLRPALQHQPGLAAAVDAGLAAADALAQRRGAERFAELPKPERRDVLNEVAAAQPGFLPGLIFHTYVGYYQDARVVEALGLEARPPHPKGYEIESSDLALLDAVRRRPKLYRSV